MNELLKQFIQSDTGMRITAALGRFGQELQFKAGLEYPLSSNNIKALENYGETNNLFLFAKNNPDQVIEIGVANASVENEDQSQVRRTRGDRYTEYTQEVHDNNQTLISLLAETLDENKHIGDSLRDANFRAKVAQNKLQIFSRRKRKNKNQGE